MDWQVIVDELGDFEIKTTRNGIDVPTTTHQNYAVLLSSDAM